MLAMSAPALAEPRIGADVERHATTNALDGPAAFSDRYTVMRATGAGTAETDLGRLDVLLSGEAKQFDTLAIEDDRAAAGEVSLTRKVGERLELRGTLGASFADIGDDLAIGDVLVGTRARTTTVSAAFQAGFDLGEGISVISTTQASRARTGATMFELDVLEPLRLDPNRIRLQQTVEVRRQDGAWRQGFAASLLDVTVEPLGEPPVAFGLREYTLRAGLGHAGAGGIDVEVAAGLQLLDADAGLGRFVRPLTAARLVLPLPFGIRMDIQGFARFDSADTDDPLASHVRRGQVEASLPLGERVTLMAGAFAEQRFNLLLETVDARQGVYLATDIALRERFALTARIDHGGARTGSTGATWSTTDVQIALGRKL